MLFKKTRELEAQIDEYLDLVDRGAMLFMEGIRFYFENRKDEFEQRMEDLRRTESKGDALRRLIENRVYSHTLIPESRGDVLGILESTDKVLNMTSDTLLEFSVEHPGFLTELNALYLDLARATTSATESMIKAIRQYFRDLGAVRDYINKVYFFEKESDKIAEKIKRIIFQKEIDLSHQVQMRYFAYHIERIADEAEDVCDRLTIATIKRHE
ncbi:MAG: DUF47 family protein [Calditrichia bacterium]